MTDHDDRMRILLVDRVGYNRYRMPDGRPVLDPRHYRVSLLTNPALVGQPRAGECAEILGYEIDDETLTGAMIDAAQARAPFDRAIVFPENLQVPIAEARRRHNIPGPSPAEIVPFRDKPSMKQTAVRGCLEVADWLAIGAADDARGLLEKHGKIILKPRDGAGSAGVYPIDSPAALAAVAADLSDYQAERFIDAPMIHVDAIVTGGTVLVARTSRYTATTLSHMARQPLGSLMIDDPVLQRRSDELLEQVIQAFSVKDAVLHLEAFVVGDRLVFNEVACRAGGGGIVALMQAVTGYNLFEAMVRMAVGEAPTADYPRVAPTGGFILLYGDAGVLRGVEDSAIPPEWVIERKVAVPVGERFTPVGRAGGSLVSYIVGGDSEAQVAERLRTISESVQIDLERD